MCAPVVVQCTFHAQYALQAVVSIQDVAVSRTIVASMSGLLAGPLGTV